MMRLYATRLFYVIMLKDRLSKTAHDWGFDSSSALVEFLIERMNPILNIENYAETEGLKIPS